MADGERGVLMEYKGKRKRVPADKVETILAAGGRNLDDVNQEMQEATRESERELGISEMEQNASPLDKALTFVQGAGRRAGFGLDEKAAGLLTALPRLVPGGESPADAYERGKGRQQENNQTAMDVAPGPMIAGEFTGDVAQLLTGLKKSPIGSTSTIGGAAKEAAKPAALALGASGVASGDGVFDSALRGVAGVVAGGAGGALLGAGGKLLGDKAARALAARKAGQVADAARKVAPEMAEALPVVGGPIKAARKVINEMPPAQTLDDFVRAMPEEDLPASLAKQLELEAKTGAGAGAADDFSSEVIDGLKPKVLSPADAAAAQIDEIGQSIDAPVSPKESDQSLMDLLDDAAPEAPVAQKPSVTPTDPTVIRQRAPVAEAALPQRSAGKGKDFSDDLAEAQRIVKEGVPEPKLKRTPEEWAGASEEEMVGAIEDAAQRAQVGKRLPNAEQLRLATGLDKKTFARLYPAVRAKVFQRAPAVPKAPKPKKATPASPVEAAADDIDEIDDILGGSPIESTGPAAPVASGPLPDPDLVTAFLAQGHSKEKAIEMALAVMQKKPAAAAPAMRTRFEPSSSPAPKKRPSTAKKRPTFDGKK